LRETLELSSTSVYPLPQGNDHLGNEWQRLYLQCTGLLVIFDDLGFSEGIFSLHYFLSSSFDFGANSPY
jgi:hypothetical protein